MNSPYQPPAAKSEFKPEMPNPLYKRVLAGLVAIQLVLTLWYAPGMFEMVRTGMINVLALLYMAVGSVCLYLAMVLALRKAGAGRTFFLLATVLLFLAFRGFSTYFNIHLPLGMVLAGAGFWLAHTELKVLKAGKDLSP
jgi:hypothetical protein